MIVLLAASLRALQKNLAIRLVSPLCKKDLDFIKVGGRLNQLKAKL
jgi:hypothetical protein